MDLLVRRLDCRWWEVCPGQYKSMGSGEFWFGKFAMMEWFEWPGIVDILAIVGVRVRAVGWVVLGSFGSEEGPSFEVVGAQPHLGTTNR